MYAETFTTRFDFEALRAGFSFSYSSIPVNDHYEVVSIAAEDHTQKGFNLYLYFAKGKAGWQLFDLQYYEGTVERYYLQMLAGLGEDQVDSIIGSKDERKIFRSREQYDYMKSVYSLALDPDRQIIRYFNQNRSKFNDLKKQFVDFKLSNPDYNNYEKNVFFSESCYSGLSISNIMEYFSGLENCLTFLISDNGYDAVGYFYTDDTANVPLIDPERIFFIQEIGPGWYMFRSN